MEKSKSDTKPKLWSDRFKPHKPLLEAIKEKENMHEYGEVFCPSCVSFEVECNANQEDYYKPCEFFKEVDNG